MGVTICCPGPVSSGADVPVQRSVFGPEGMISRTEEPHAKGKVAPARYAQLVANAAAHGVDECWIAKHPVLLVGEQGGELVTRSLLPGWVCSAA